VRRAGSLRVCALQLDGGQVFLSMDPAQGEQDKYDRLLAYVWTADGALINQSTVEHGHGQGTGYGKDCAMSSTFEAASEQASAVDRTDAGPGWGGHIQASALRNRRQYHGGVTPQPGDSTRLPVAH
jgi:endonuclease YncB( thermonuclease family)